MSFTNKVSNIIKQKIATHLISGFTNKISGFGQPKKLAAKLANKSPLDLSKSPVAHMGPEANPYTYGSVYYPQETAQLGEGHYIIFDIIENSDTRYGSDMGDQSMNKAYPYAMGTVGEGKLNNLSNSKKLTSKKFSASDRVLRKQTSGMDTKTNAYKSYISDSIILYTPSTGTKFDYKVSYGNTPTGIAGQVAGLMDLKSLGEKSLDIGARFLETVTRSALEVALPGFGAALDKGLGRALNPNAELVFESVPFRQFSFPYEFAPKNEKEKEDVQKILSMFKFHMMPEKAGEGYLTAPAQFQITYMYRDGANMYIPKISRCALESMSVDYSPEGVFTTFKADEKGAAPVLTKVELSFTEMEIMTKETIAIGH